ncbi:MAG: LptF/LptG family permease [Endomicrobiia bacterium]
MKVLRKYIILEFFRIFIPVSLFLILIFALSEFFWRLPDFITHKTSYFYISYYLFLHIPLWFVQTLPITLMLTTLLLITHLQYTQELISIKTLGVNTRNFFMFLAIIGIIFSIISFYTYENLATRLFSKAQIFFDTKIKKIPKIEHVLKNLFYHDSSNNVYIYIGEYDVKNKTIKNWLVEKFKDNFLEYFMFSPYGIKKNGIVELRNCIIYKYFKNKYISQTKISSYKYFLSINIEDFQHDYHNMQLDQKSIKELKKIIEFVKYKGDSPARFLTEVQFRYVISFLNFIVILFAIPLGQISKAKYSNLISFLYTMIILVIYWVILSILKSLCEIGVLHYIFVWSANFLFLLIGIFLYIKIR